MSQLPLFPLRVVLFPGSLLPLHIFEPRYQALLTAVTAGDHRFGLLPPGEQGGLPAPGSIGCAAQVRAVQPLPEGRSNIVVSGERRFRFLEPAPAPTPYHQGLVDWVDDLPDVQIPSEAELRRLRALAERYALALNALHDQTLDVSLSDHAAELSFEAAALLEWEFEPRQQLLEMRSATQRVIRLLQVLPALVRHAEERAERHGHAKTNGHGSIA
ncbi:MAG TPA: LON peptidase substrate-binding domain-containing protein [Gemmatimonadales bacterium]|nr:LON peptidase substrate-binding domain-containing protein [Gemmatimonadales bacterium]